MTSLKNHPREIFWDNNHLYGIILLYLTLNIGFKARKVAGYWSPKNSSNSKFWVAPDHICKATGQIKHCADQHNFMP